MTVHTRNLSSGSITINRADGVYGLAVKAQGGSVNITGNATFQGVASQQITLAESDTFFLSAEASQPISGVTITAGSGTAVLQIFLG